MATLSPLPPEAILKQPCWRSIHRNTFAQIGLDLGRSNCNAAFGIGDNDGEPCQGCASCVLARQMVGRSGVGLSNSTLCVKRRSNTRKSLQPHSAHVRHLLAIHTDCYQLSLLPTSILVVASSVLHLLVMVSTRASSGILARSNG